MKRGKIWWEGRAPKRENLPAGGGLQHPPLDPLLQLRSLHDLFLSYKTQSSSTKRTLLKLRG